MYSRHRIGKRVLAGYFGGSRLASQSPLRKETILNLGEFHGCRAFLVVVSHLIDPSAYRIAPHQPSIIGHQQFGHRNHHGVGFRQLKVKSGVCHGPGSAGEGMGGRPAASGFRKSNSFLAYAGM